MGAQNTKDQEGKRWSAKMIGMVLVLLVALIAGAGYSYWATVKIERVSFKVKRLQSSSEKLRNNARSLTSTVAELEDQIERERYDAEIALEEAVEERDLMWMEAVENTYHHHWRPDSVLNNEIAIWNRQEIVAETGWTLKREWSR